MAPFFGLILLGFACGRYKKIPEAGLAWMQFYLIYVSLPALFFMLVRRVDIEELANGWFILATTLCTALAFVLSLAVGLAFTRKDLPQAVMQGVAGSYSNIGYMGPPLVLAALGAGAAAPVALIFVFDNLFLFSIVPLLMALAGAEKRSLAATMGNVAFNVVTHPFNVATVLGVVAAETQIVLPVFIEKMLEWLYASAAPCALFVLGVTVALRPLGKVPLEVPVLVVIKLVLHPFIVWLALSILGDFEPIWVFAAVTMAALPPALNIFVISTQYKTGVERASACVLIGTLTSIVTLTFVLWLIKTGNLPPDPF
ncbi:MAG: AEC family transporter [Candidatus Competibacteraceae bacterium]|nr:AEC family transporter [Candidatus Competibacteraceae bacterium]